MRPGMRTPYPTTRVSSTCTAFSRLWRLHRDESTSAFRPGSSNWEGASTRRQASWFHSQRDATGPPIQACSSLSAGTLGNPYVAQTRWFSRSRSRTKGIRETIANWKARIQYGYVLKSLKDCRPRNGRRDDMAWTKALEDASRTVTQEASLSRSSPDHTAAPTSHANPFDLVADDLHRLDENIKKLLENGHPTLHKISNYYFEKPGKRMRPLLVLLISQAANCTTHVGGTNPKGWDWISKPISKSSAPPASTASHAETGRSAPHAAASVSSSFLEGRRQAHSMPSRLTLLPTQRRLAEITEMIHTASLLHDDVIDTAALRRSVQSVNSKFGDKLAILAGDYLLATASVALARLRNVEVVELLATVIANLVEGEFMQLRRNVSHRSLCAIRIGSVAEPLC